MCYFKSHLTDEEHHRVSSANFKPLFGQSTNACRVLSYSWTLIPLHSPRWGQSSWNNRQKDIRSSPKSVSAPCALWVQKGNHGWADMRQCSYPVVPPDFLLAHERWERALVVEKERKGLCRNGHGWERKTHGSGLSFFELGCGEMFEGW